MLVLHNRDLAEVTWEQREMEGDPRFATSQALPAFPYADVRRPPRPAGHPGRRPGRGGRGLGRALAADRPVVIEAVVDPDVPLLPPFPAGEEKLDSIRRGLDQEGAAGAHAWRLLEQQAAQEPTW